MQKQIRENNNLNEDPESKDQLHLGVSVVDKCDVEDSSMFTSNLVVTVSSHPDKTDYSEECQGQY